MTSPTPRKLYVPIEDEKVIRLAIRQGKLIACYVHSSTKRIRRRDLDDWLSALPERPR